MKLSNLIKIKKSAYMDNLCLKIMYMGDLSLSLIKNLNKFTRKNYKIEMFR